MVKAASVVVGLRLDTSTYLRSVREAAAKGGKELSNLNRLQTQQNRLLSDVQRLGKTNLSLAKGVTTAQKLQLAQGAKEVAIAQLRLKTSNDLLKIEKAMVGQSGKGAEKLKKELLATLKIKNQLTGKKIELGFQSEVSHIKAASAQAKLLRAGLTGAGNAAKGLGNTLKGLTVATGIGALLVGLSAIAAVAATPIAAVKHFLELDQVLADLGSVTGQTREQMSPLTAEIKRLGIETSKSPTQIADTALALSRMGFSAEETKAALEGVARASEATGQDMAIMAEVIGTVVKVNQLNAEAAAEVADIIVATSNNSSQSADQMGEAWGKAAINGAAFNQTIESQALALGVLANAGLRGDEGGTAYENMVKAITAQRTEWEKIGIAVFDAQGKMEQLPKIADELREKLKGFSDKEKISILEQLTPDIRGQRGFLAYIGQAGDAVDKLKAKIEGSEGAAKTASESRLNTFSGQVELLKGTLASFADQAGEAFAPFFRAGGEALNQVVVELLKSGDLFEEIKATGVEFAQTLKENPDIIQNITAMMSTLISKGLDVAVELANKLINFLKDPEATEKMVAGMASFTSGVQGAITLAGQLLNVLTAAANMLQAATSGANNTAAVINQGFLGGGRTAIGRVGSTGHSTGAHAHIQAQDGSKLNLGDVNRRFDFNGKKATRMDVSNTEAQHAARGSRGIDVALPSGTEIQAIGVKSVSATQYDDRSGYYNIITFQDGFQVLVAHQLKPTSGQGNARAGNAAPMKSTRPQPAYNGPVPSSGGSPNAVAGSSSSTGSNPQGKAKQAYDFFRSKGYSEYAAATAAGVIRQESGFDSEAVGDGGSALGLFQWHGDRRSSSFPHSNFAGQLEYAAQELGGQNGYSGFNAAMKSNDPAVVQKAFDKTIRQGHTGDRYKYGEEYYQQYKGTSSGGGGGGGGGSRDPLVTARLTELEGESDEAKAAESAAKEAERAAEEARRAALAKAKEARQAGMDVRSERDKTADLAKDAATKAARDKQDMDLAAVEAANPNSDIVKLVTERSKEYNSVYRKYSDDIESNNKAARGIQQAIADEKSKGTIEEPVNKEVIAQYEKQAAQLGKSNEQLRNLRDQEVGILTLKNQQLDADAKALTLRERAVKLEAVNRDNASLRSQYEIGSSDNPEAQLKGERDSQQAEIDNNYLDLFAASKVELEKIAKDRDALLALDQTNPVVIDQLKLIYERIEAETILNDQLMVRYGLENNLANLNVDKYFNEQRGTFDSGLGDRNREANLSNLGRVSPYARAAQERATGRAGIDEQKAKDYKQAQDIYGEGSIFANPQLLQQSADQIDRIAAADLQNLIDQTKTLGEVWADDINTKVEDTFLSIIDGSATAGEAFSSLFADIAKQLAALGVSEAFKGLFGGWGQGAESGGKGSGIGGALLGSLGKIFNFADGHIPNYAGGSPVAGVGGLLAAASRESAAMPVGASLVVANSSEAVLTRSQQGNVASSLANGGGGSVTVTVNNMGSVDVFSNGDGAKRLAALIKSGTQQEISRASRSDGQLGSQFKRK